MTDLSIKLSFEIRLDKYYFAFIKLIYFTCIGFFKATYLLSFGQQREPDFQYILVLWMDVILNLYLIYMYIAIITPFVITRRFYTLILLNSVKRNFIYSFEKSGLWFNGNKLTSHIVKFGIKITPPSPTLKKTMLLITWKYNSVPIQILNKN